MYDYIIILVAMQTTHLVCLIKNAHVLTWLQVYGLIIVGPIYNIGPNS